MEWVPPGAEPGAQHADSPASAAADDDVVLPAEAPIRAVSVNAGIAARALASEGIIVVPTDTLYGAATLSPKQ